MLEISSHNLLAWAPLTLTLSAIETELMTQGLTLGPAAYWQPQITLQKALQSGCMVRFNPLLGQVEEAIGAFEYRHAGQTHRTLSAPREACGPELRQMLYEALNQVDAVQLRLLPSCALTRVTVTAPRHSQESFATLVQWLRSALMQQCFYRSIFLKKELLELTFAGAMADIYVPTCEQLAEQFELAIETTTHAAIDEQLLGFQAHQTVPTAVPFAKLQPHHTLALADLWSIYVSE